MFPLVALLQTVQSYPKEACSGPIAFADQVEGGKLIQVQVLIRHGARTPGKNHLKGWNLGEWHCDDPNATAPRYHPAPVLHPRNYHENFDQRLTYWKPSCRKQDLTLLGMQQHLELGSAYRKHYVDELNFLDKNMNPESIYIRASELDRTVKSAVSFVQGMYPPASPNEVVPIITDTPAAGIIHPDSEWCKEIKDQEEYYLQNGPIVGKFNEFKAKYPEIFKKYKIKEIKDAKKFSSMISISACSDHKLPDELTGEFIDDCMRYLSFYNYHMTDNEKYRGVSISPLYREMFRIADEKISMEGQTKFALLSSHDGALTAFLSTLGYFEEYGPAVRAHIAFELWERDGQVLARFCVNGRPIKVSFLGNDPGKDGGLFLYANLKSEMARLGYLSHCFVPEWK